MNEAESYAEFYTERARLLAERDAAYVTRDEDRERWNAAKTAYGDFRTNMRVLGAPDVADADVAVPVETVVASGDVHEGV